MPVNANFNEFETNMGNKTQFNWKKRRKKETSYNNNNNKLNNEFNAHFNPSSFHSFELRLSRFDALIHTRIGWFDIPINKERKTMSFGCLAVWLFSIENLYAHCFVEHRENGLILLHTTATNTICLCKNMRLKYAFVAQITECVCVHRSSWFDPKVR